VGDRLSSSDESDRKATSSSILVVSLIIEIQGDETRCVRIICVPQLSCSCRGTSYVAPMSRFDGAGYSVTGTREVLSSIASDVLVNNGNCVNAVELFWVPGDPQAEVLSKNDLIIDFPELIDL
jgi:hypothetical protein